MKGHSIIKRGLPPTPWQKKSLALITPPDKSPANRKRGGGGEGPFFCAGGGSTSKGDLRDMAPFEENLICI